MIWRKIKNYTKNRCKIFWKTKGELSQVGTWWKNFEKVVKAISKQQKRITLNLIVLNKVTLFIKKNCFTQLHIVKFKFVHYLIQYKFYSNMLVLWQICLNKWQLFRAIWLYFFYFLYYFLIKLAAYLARLCWFLQLECSFCIIDWFLLILLLFLFAI